VKGSITVLKGGKAKGNNKGVIVYLEGVPGTPPVPKNHAVIRQREKQFEPPLTIVVKGTTIDFPNEDKIFHNVFSVSRPARFDLGLYKSGTMKSVELKRAGVVDVYCNIHPDMVAKVKVLENAYYTVTGKDGTFKIENVPAGEYPIIAWMQTGDEAKGTVKVSAGGSAEVKLDVSEVAKKTTHTRKDGTPYGRYK
jgi:plastocyanin